MAPKFSEDRGICLYAKGQGSSGLKILVLQEDLPSPKQISLNRLIPTFIPLITDSVATESIRRVHSK